MATEQTKRFPDSDMARPRRKTPVAGIKRQVSKGRVYYYHRATGRRLQHDPNSAAGLLEIAALDEKARARALLTRRSGSLADIFAAYKAGDAVRAGKIRPWRALKPRTRADYADAMDYLSSVAGDLYPGDMRPRHVQRIIDLAAEDRGWAFGDKLLSVLRLTINWGLYHEQFDPGEGWSHPCKDVLAPQRADDAPDANRPWKDDERAAVVEAGRLEWLVLYALCLYGAMNISDAIAIPKAALATVRHEDGSQTRRIRWRRGKNAEEIDIPVSGSPLEAFLNAAPAHNAPTIAANSRGKPWTYAGADTERKRLLARLEAAGRVGDGLTFHGLRCTFATVAAEGGANSRQIAAGINDASESMGARYSRGAAKDRLAATARKPLFERDERLISPILAARLENNLENSARVIKLKPKKSR